MGYGGKSKSSVLHAALRTDTGMYVRQQSAVLAGIDGELAS